MPTPSNPELYEKIKKEVWDQYKKPSAYRSGQLVKKYKEAGGKYLEDNEEKNLARWFAENWQRVGPFKNDEKSYPVYRPTKRISEKTPLTVEEIDPIDLMMKSIQKQKIKGKENLKPFKPKI
jgi:hypothetical protein